jgi:release factor glutamine methyltransferase
MSRLSVGGALARARAAGLDRLDAQLLVGHVAGRPRTWLLAHDDAALDDAQAAALDVLDARAPAASRWPTSSARRNSTAALQVDARVLVPRPDTETLVDWALETAARPAARARRGVDLGTGSGAIALA